jgi:hypothetical protein
LQTALARFTSAVPLHCQPGLLKLLQYPIAGGCKARGVLQRLQLDLAPSRPVLRVVGKSRRRRGRVGSREIAREFCVNQSCTILHRRAISATSAPANQLMQLTLQFSAWD